MNDGGIVPEPLEASAYPEVETLREVLQRTLDNYLTVKLEPQGGHPFNKWFRRLPTALKQIIPNTSDLRIDYGSGHGSNWSYIPYIAFRRHDIAPSTQYGVYPAYVFSGDMSSVYLSLNQGAANAVNAKNNKTARLREIAVSLRSLVEIPEKFKLDKISLGFASQAASFESGHVCGKQYQAGSLPNEQLLQEELSEMLALYRAIDAQEIQAIIGEKPLKQIPLTFQTKSAQTPDRDYTFEELQEDILWDDEDLHELIDALAPANGFSRQVVLTGPPGTGKTWVAKQVVRFLTKGDTSRSRLVQFHSSYSYEQFIEGLRPVVKSGGIDFERVDGVVIKLAKECLSSPDRRFLIIDEINRANLPRVLGELLYLFEYRDEAVDLQFTEGFKLPANLVFFATMNTADRSIRSIDAALRRRFDFIQCPADARILESFYSKVGRLNEVTDLVEGFKALNEFLKEQLDEYHQIGQTFFMDNRFTPTTLELAWKRKIFPTIAEYFFDQPDVLKELTVERFWPSLG